MRPFVGSREGTDVVAVGLAAFALINVATGLYAAIAPGSFFDTVGPFGPHNDHYVRDAAAAMQGSLGVAMVVAYFRREWRIGVLGYALLHYSFHALNHLADIGDSDPKAVGPIDFALLAAAAATIAWLLVRATREARA